MDEHIVIKDRYGMRISLSLAPGMSIAIIGLDGTGKSTASEMLEKALSETGVPVACFHWYSAFQTCLMVPFAVLRNRWTGQAVQVFDRSIFDNFAVWLQRVPDAGWRRRLMNWAVGATRLFYPRFDAVIHLTASADVIRERRPELTPQDIARGREAYGLLSDALRTKPLDTISVAREAGDKLVRR